MLDPQKLFRGLVGILETALGKTFPPLGVRLLAGVLALGFVLAAVAAALKLLNEIKKSVRELLPLFASDDDRRRAERRRLFADHIDTEIRRLNGLESWQDHRFAELEAEVEAEGRSLTGTLLGLWPRRTSALTRETSLSEALRRSEERLVLLEGEPGAGKSVALRHLAQILAAPARGSRSTRSLIPLYVNLKEFQPPARGVDRDTVRAFVLRYLNRINDRDVEEFLEQEFDRGLREGTWLFLFDSFDEIPAVLGATEADGTVRTYADAISDFLRGMNRCRCVVASRVFRGPAHTAWPRFRILPLTDERRGDLVRRAGLSGEGEDYLLAAIAAAGPDIRMMASNPMFLGLLCDHVSAGLPFPANAHVAFEAYIDRRLTRDQERLERRYRIAAPRLKTTAEAIAFAMTADARLGLSPTRSAIKQALAALGRAESDDPGRDMDALEYLKLARSETQASSGEDRSFTFAHRRFQEYFATCLVLREPLLLSPRQFLLDARWRETAVVLCHTRPADTLHPLFDEAAAVLDAALAELETPVVPSATAPARTPAVSEWRWPAHALHVLMLLQDGFAGRTTDLPSSLRRTASEIVSRAMATGTLLDRKWAIEIAGTMPEPDLVVVLRHGLSDGSRWLREVAYRQAARLAHLPPDLRAEIRRVLIEVGLSGRLRGEWYAIEAHLRRLPDHETLLDGARLLYSLASIDVMLHLVTFLILTAFLSRFAPAGSLTVLSVVVAATLAASHAVVRPFAAPRFVGRLRVALMYPAGFTFGALWGKTGATAPPVSDAATLAVVCVLLYTLAWMPSAVTAVRTELFTRRLLWPVVPLAPVVHYVRDRMSVELRKAAPMLGSIATLGFLFVAGAKFLAPIRPRSPAAEAAGTIIVVFAVLLVLLVAVVAAVTMIAWGLEKLRLAAERVRWWRWAKAPSPVRAGDLELLLARYRTAAAKARLLRAVRTGRLLESDAEAFELLRDLGVHQEHVVCMLNEALAEVATAISRSRWNPNEPNREAIMRTARNVARLPRFLHPWNMNRHRRALTRVVATHDDLFENLDLRDEIAMLREQVSQRLAEAAPGQVSATSTPRTAQA